MCLEILQQMVEIEGLEHVKLVSNLAALHYPPLSYTSFSLRGVEWGHGLFLFPLVLGKCSSHMQNLVFLCSLDYLLQKNAIVVFFENQISKRR